jgi:hypothetical protein
MSQTGYTPILIYGSSTASNVPLAANLTSSASGVELALNYADGKLFYKDSGGVVQVLATKAGALGTVTSVAASVPSFLSIAGSPITSSGTLAITLSGTALPTTSGGTGLTSFTANGVVYASSSSVLTTGSALVFNGTDFATTGKVASGTTGSAGRFDLARASDGGVACALGLSGNDFSANNGAGGGYIFNVSSSEKMRLDSSGNLGLGVTPSAWDSGYQVLQNTGGALWSGSSTAVRLTQNTYFATSFKYVANTFASQYVQTSGQHQWFNAASGTAGNTISFTQAMTLDASGNLGIGTTSPADVQLTTVVSVNAASGYCGFRVLSNGTAVGRLIGNAGNEFRIDSLSTNPLTFYTNGSERARIDSSGNLLVGTTNQSLENSRSFVWIGSSGGVFRVNHSTTNASGDGYFEFGYNGTKIGSITQNGTTATAYNTSSDYRLKNITGPITTSGAYIDSLKPVEGIWKADGSTFVGLIAHEAQEVSRTPIATGEKDGVEMQGMSYSNSEMIANMIAELKSLRQRVAQLESN